MMIKGRAPRKGNSAAVDLIGSVQLAQRWKMSPRTLARWRTLGFGPTFIRADGAVFYAMAVVQQFERAGLQIPVLG